MAGLFLDKLLMFIATSFIEANIWKQLKCPSVDEWIKILCHIYTLQHYLVIKKEGNLTLCDSMDGPGDYYAKKYKTVRKRQIPYDLTHMWNLMNKIN